MKVQIERDETFLSTQQGCVLSQMNWPRHEYKARYGGASPSKQERTDNDLLQIQK